MAFKKYLKTSYSHFLFTIVEKIEENIKMPKINKNDVHWKVRSAVVDNEAKI